MKIIFENESDTIQFDKVKVSSFWILAKFDDRLFILMEYDNKFMWFNAHQARSYKDKIYHTLEDAIDDLKEDFDVIEFHAFKDRSKYHQFVIDNFKI